MVTATTGTAQFVDLTTKELLAVSFYISDVIGAKLTWNQQGVAGAGSDTTVQFKNPVMISDISILAGPTVATGWNWYAGGIIVPSSANLIATNLTSVQTRNFTRTGFRAGTLISAVQY